ncbi:hypothetical protein IAQ61_003184 [Plenodomus lingam]|uniref:uncharacterized protein n=1 Tax=Leptosphaeria maculans TaxID=5022 RepID=UPI00332B1C4A|nr:hypothetical protein IAQ61_003184 [Plenodomus lingam]
MAPPIQYLLSKPHVNHATQTMSRQTKPHASKNAQGLHSQGHSRGTANTPYASRVTSIQGLNTKRTTTNTTTSKHHPKLKQHNYLRYSQSLRIFHYASSYLPLPLFQSLLSRPSHGYITTLLSRDPLHSNPIPTGDETPPGCTEVVYMASVFHNGGSALGFRTGAASGGAGADRVEWLCFERKVDERILSGLRIKCGRRGKVNSGLLFDCVAVVEKGRGCGLRARGEHWAWWDALSGAGHPRWRVRLGWRGFGTEVATYWAYKVAQAQAFAMWEEMEREVEEDIKQEEVQYVSVDEDQEGWQDMEVDDDASELMGDIDTEESNHVVPRVAVLATPEQSVDARSGNTTPPAQDRDDA